MKNLISKIGQTAAAIGTSASLTGCMTPSGPSYAKSNVLPISEREVVAISIPAYNTPRLKIGEENYKAIAAPRDKVALVDGKNLEVQSGTYFIPNNGSQEIIVNGKRTTTHTFNENYFLVPVDEENPETKINHAGKSHEKTRVIFAREFLNPESESRGRNTTEQRMRALLKKIPQMNIGGENYFAFPMGAGSEDPESNGYLDMINPDFQEGMLTKIFIKADSAKPVTIISYRESEKGEQAIAEFSLQGKQYLLKEGSLINRPEPVVVKEEPAKETKIEVRHTGATVKE